MSGTPKDVDFSSLYLRVVRIDGWKTCNFTSVSTVFQSYQDNEWMIMKGCMQWNPLMASGRKAQSAQ